MKLNRILIVLILSILVSTGASASNIEITINGALLHTDVAPRIINGRTLVPMRSIFEAMGAMVEWDGYTQTVTGTKDSKVIRLQIGNSKANINEVSVKLDTPATIINGRTFVPVRFIAESLGSKVNWDDKTRTVIINDEKINIEKIIFKDKAFEEEVRKTINKPRGDILKTDVQNITELIAEYPLDSLIKSIEGIEHMVNLEKIEFWRNAITDIGPLSKLTKLKSIQLGDNNISDISSLSNLKNLESLSLDRNYIVNVNPLRNLTNLKELNLSFNNDLIDLSPLDSLKLLEHPMAEQYSITE